MLFPGAAGWVAVLVGLYAAYRRAPRRRAFPVGGRLALGAIALAEALLPAGAPGAATCFMPAMLTAFVAAVDAAVYALRGHSPMRNRSEAFSWMAVLSIFLWIVFEIYNARLAAWHYGGLPNDMTRYLALGWSFAMIWPGVLGTAAFLSATVFRGPSDLADGPRTRGGGRFAIPAIGAGVLCLTLPLLAPRLDFGEHLFALVVCGWAVLLDPLNVRAGLPGIWGGRSRLYALLGAGPLCGFVWGFWNVRAGARAYSTNARTAVFELPLEAFLSMSLFGPAAFAMYVFAANRLHLPFFNPTADSGAADS